MLKILHVADSIELISGGLGLAALRLGEAQSNYSNNIWLLVNGRNAGVSFESTPGSALNLIFSPPFGLRSFGSRFRWISEFLTRCLPQGVHIHGVWTPFLFEVAVAASRAGLPIFVSPHGCFESWSLSQKSVKKRLALWSYQGWLNRRALAFFATAIEEVQSLRNLGVHQAVALVPNGVDIPCENRPVAEKENIALFMSRIHPKKGLLDLVAAWKQVGKPGWRVIVAGPDEGGYQAIVDAEIRRAGLDSVFEFVGLVSGAEKSRLFDRAKFFVLPTRSENFGIVIGEALAHSLPVITTTGAPWSSLNDYECGWWVSPTVDGLTSALRTALDLPDKVLAEMGERGRRLVIENFSWDYVARRSMAVYRWTLSGGELPEFVFIAR